jgi:hypothetical protein
MEVGTTIRPAWQQGKQRLISLLANIPVSRLGIIPKNCRITM